jgi:hypothetical protein
VDGSPSLDAIVVPASRKVICEEEFGDIVGEGLIGQVHIGPLDPARSPSFWSEFLDRRADFMAATANACRRSEREDAGLALAVLDTAGSVRSCLSPMMLAEYVRAWWSDRITWRRHLSGIRTRDDLPSALADLGLEADSIDRRPAGTVS